MGGGDVCKRISKEGVPVVNCLKLKLKYRLPKSLVEANLLHTRVHDFGSFFETRTYPQIPKINLGSKPIRASFEADDCNC